MEWQTIATILAAAYNLSILVVTRGFSNDQFFKVDPLFDKNGCALVIVWGLAYLSAAWNWKDVPFLFLVFALEKIFYTVHWWKWLGKKDAWREVAEKDPSANSFFNMYGAGDALFGAAFLAISVTSLV